VPRRKAWLAFIGAFWPFILGSLLVAGGLAAIVLGYLGVAGTLVVGLQLPYLVSGARLTRRVLEELRGGDRPPPAAEGEPADGVVVATRGGRWFHRPTCELVKGKDVRRMRAGSAAARRLDPCRICDPPLRSTA
jgi:hypothetical protein